MGLPLSNVDLNMHHSDGMVWDMTSIPYKQGERCILRERLDIESFVHPSYTIKNYLHIYDVITNPIKNPIF